MLVIGGREVAEYGTSCRDFDEKFNTKNVRFSAGGFILSSACWFGGGMHVASYITDRSRGAICNDANM
jgi:hypothetical protein